MKDKLKPDTNTQILSFIASKFLPNILYKVSLEPAVSRSSTISNP
jgi:hypothetical protein